MSLHNFCVIFILCRTAAGDVIWTPYLVIRGAYNFQAHESSAFIKVSLLLAAAYGAMGLNIEPDVPFNLPIVKKRGRPYAVDCLVAEYLAEENSNDTSDGTEELTNLLVKEKKTIKMVVEIKKSIGKTMLLLEPPDLIELFIYCHYTLWTNKLRVY